MTTSSTPRRLIVPVAGAGERANAVAIAEDIARRLGVGVEVVTIVDPDVEAAADGRVETRHDGVAVTTVTIRAESVEDSLIELARRPGVLMCVASSGRTAVVESLTGSVSASILQQTISPMLVVGPECEPSFRGTILAIAVDGTPDGEMIVEPALDLAAALGLSPMLYQVLPEGVQAFVGDAGESTYVARLAEQSARPGVVVQYEVLHDRTAGRGLSRLTVDDEVAMVAMSSHGHAPRERLFLPSTAHQLIRHARCPVLLGPRTAPIVPFDHGDRRRVVVGVDGSVADQGALAVAVDQAEHRDAVVEVVHAWSRSWYFVEGGMTIEGDTEADRKAARAILDAAVGRVRELSPSVGVFDWLVERLPADALLEAAIGADLVVLGEHRYNLLERVTLGSTTHAVVHRAPVPVIVVPEWVRLGVSPEPAGSVGGR